MLDKILSQLLDTVLKPIAKIFDNLVLFHLQEYFDRKDQLKQVKEALVEYKYNPSPELLVNICANLDYHKIAYTLPLDVESIIKKL